jgi:predicted GNAT superfamily acetyltransferase
MRWLKVEIKVRDCTTIEEFDQCIRLQREAFALPDMEISPRRHLIVTRRAGGWTLGAFAGREMVGFVHHLVAVRNLNEIIGYSHMMAVAKDYQNRGVGAQLKWAQRERALGEGRNFIKWTWDPMQARNAHFNLNRLGVVVRSYGENFYGTDYITMPHESTESIHLDSDRLFAEWQLDSSRVNLLAAGRTPDQASAPIATIEIPPDWSALVRTDAAAAHREQLRVRAEFAQAFAAGLVCASFERDEAHPRYLLYRSDR